MALAEAYVTGAAHVEFWLKPFLFSVTPGLKSGATENSFSIKVQLPIYRTGRKCSYTIKSPNFDTCFIYLTMKQLTIGISNARADLKKEKKAALLKSIKNGLEEVEAIKKGKMKSIPLDKLLEP